LTGCGGGGHPAATATPAQPAETATATAAPPGADTSARVRHRPLARAIAEYQRKGFFAGARPAALARRIPDRYRREGGEDLVLRTRFDELVLLHYDHRRVWFSDIERDVLPGNDEYVAALREWSRISQGAFRPRDVSERWASADAGPAQITFRLG